MAEKKKESIVEENEMYVLSRHVAQFVVGFARSKKMLETAQKYLFMAGIVLAVLLLLFSLLPIIVPALRSADFSGITQFLGSTLAILAVFFIPISFVRINILSKTEQQQEQVRQLRIKLKALRFRIEKAELEDDLEKAQKLESEYLELKIEHDSLIDESPQKWEQDVFTGWGKTLVASRNRLLDEDDRLRQRNRANLQYGAWAAAVGIGFFLVVGSISYYDGSLKALSLANFPFYYLLSLPVAIISEILAIFFLRLYASTEKSIERNKNELTNIELRLTAGQLLEYKTDESKFDSLSNDLAKEERNFVLNKNESSSEFDIDRAVEIATKVIKAGAS